MHLNNLIPRHLQSRCVTCTGPAPQCNCASNETCFQVSPSCDACASVQCVANNTSGSSSSGSSGISRGAVAGAVVAVVIALAAVIGLYIWYRRRRAATDGSVVEPKPDIPAPAEAVLNRPDPSEKLTSRPPTELLNTLRGFAAPSDSTIDLDTEAQRSPTGRSPRESAQSNPFSDVESIQTTGSCGTEGTNVIPIAFVPPAMSLLAASSTVSEPNYLAPMRPARSPDLDLNSDPLNVTRDGVRVPYAQSQISGISGVSSRNSYISNMSYSSEMLNEAPIIVTPNQGVVRQVIGSVKAEMVSASSPTSSLGPSLKSRPSIRSPLAAMSFGPSDVLSEHEEVPALPTHSPFDDGNVTQRANSPNSVTTFGLAAPGITVSPANALYNSQDTESSLPWTQPDQRSRPSSISSQTGSLIAGSIINIGSATRVQVGMHNSPANGGQQNLRSPYRTTMGRLVTPKSNENLGTLQQQQQKALAHAQARARAQGGDRRRVSGSSAMSNTGDSILESFPFVPPSPISDRPIRSPPRSPNHPAIIAGPKAPPLQQWLPPPPEEPLPAPRDRRTLGMSTGSQLSTASSGLGSFPFQIDGPPPSNDGVAPGRQRASLDTLALTSDVSSYPLGYDRVGQREGFPPRS